jgi:hypothetical protein
VIRADEDASGGIIQKAMLRLAISSDVFIADLGDGNPNVIYEVGVRHGSRRGLAILVAPVGSHVPFNISYSRVLSYGVEGSGRLQDAEVERVLEAMGPLQSHTSSCPRTVRRTVQFGCRKRGPFLKNSLRLDAGR